MKDGESARQRDGAARAQFRPLDDRRRDHQPVRKPRARGAWSAAGRYLCAWFLGHVQLDRRSAGCGAGVEYRRRALARLRQAGAAGAQGGSCHGMRTRRGATGGKVGRTGRHAGA